MLLTVLKNKKFRKFFLDDLFACFGIGLLTTGTSWYILATTQSAWHLGFMTTLNVLAGFITSLVIGSVVDQFDRRKMLYLSSWVRILAIFLVMILFIIYEFSPTLMYLLAVINGIGWNIYVTSSRSFSQEQLISGNALSEISLQAGMLVSGIGAGYVLRTASFEMLLVIYMTVFLISSLFIWSIKHQSAFQKNGQDAPFIQLF